MTDPADLATRLDVLADDILRLGRVSRATFAPVVWDDTARAELDRRLVEHDTELGAVVARLSACASLLRSRAGS